MQPLLLLVVGVSVEGGDLGLLVISLLLLELHLVKLMLLELYCLDGRVIHEHLRLRPLQHLGVRDPKRS